MQRRSGTVLLLVICLLFGCSVIVFAAARLSLDGAGQGAARFRRSAANWAARGGLNVAVSNLARYEPQPARMLRDTPPKSFQEHAKDKPVGWFVAKGAYVTDDKAFTIESEQARAPLSALTTAAITALFSKTGQDRFKQAVASRKVKATSGGITAERSEIFRHPYELLTIGVVTRNELFGQDFNDNGVLEDFETEHQPLSPIKSASGPPRGLLDVVTACTDNRFDPYEASDDLRDKFLADFGKKVLGLLANAKAGRPPPQLIAPDDAVWVSYARANLVNVSTFFRIKAFGTIAGDPISRAEAVVEFVPGDPKKSIAPFYRIAQWRVDL